MTLYRSTSKITIDSLSSTSSTDSASITKLMSAQPDCPWTIGNGNYKFMYTVS